MSDKPTPKENQPEKSGIAPQAPSRVNQILQELEIMSLHKGTRGNVDISLFDKDQKDKLLELMAKNEDNAIDYHKTKINAIKEIELARISGANTNGKTVRYVLLLAILLVIVTTLLILFFKDEFFIPWLTFLTGFVGGIGAPKALKALKQTDERESSIKMDEEYEDD